MPPPQLLRRPNLPRARHRAHRLHRLRRQVVLQPRHPLAQRLHVQAVRRQPPQRRDVAHVRGAPAHHSEEVPGPGMSVLCGKERRVRFNLLHRL